MGFAKYTATIMMVALFTIAILTFAVNFGIDNDSSINIADDGDYSSIRSRLSDDVEVFYENVNVSNNAFQTSTISSQTEASEGGTQFKVTPTTSLSMAKRGITAGWTKIFGSGNEFSVVFTALISMLGFLMALYAYKAWVGRNPD